MIGINERLKKIVDEFRKSTTQSEEEIRSKFIVPLLCYLGYPSYLRAEEFPVYGFEGGKQLAMKKADFILFTDADYAAHRSSSNENITWVQQHSLLVAEAKNTGEIPEVLGQPQYYTIWTRSIAYFITDGYTFRGYMYQPMTSDYETLSCLVDDLPERYEIEQFSFEKLLLLKNRSNQQIGEIRDAFLEVLNGELIETDVNNAKRILSPDDKIHIPETDLLYMKNALGKNAKGLDDYSTVKTFLSMTDSYLQNDIRYDAPEYMIDIPRKRRNAFLFINNQFVPILSGTITIFYQDEKEKYVFENDLFTICLAYEQEKLVYISAEYKCLNRDVELRIQELEKVYNILSARKLGIWIQEYEEKTQIVLENAAMRTLHKEKTSVAYWLEEIRKIEEIQKHYGITIVLDQLEKGEETANLYRNVDIVYNGIKMQKNMVAEIDRFALGEDINITEPYKITIPQINLQEKGLAIHNYWFIPNEVYLLPVSIQQKGKRVRPLEFCVTFSVDPGNG